MQASNDRMIAYMKQIILEYDDLINNRVHINPIIPQGTNLETLKEVVKYCTNYIQDPPFKKKGYDSSIKELRLNQWDKNFCHQLDQVRLFDVILVANLLDLTPLVDVTCLYIASKLKSMTPNEIRNEYNITKNFTQAGEDQARREFEDMILGTIGR